MPFASLPLIGFALGAGLSWVSVGKLSASVRSLQAQALLVVVLLGALALAPVAALVAGAAPAWVLGYWVDPASLVPWLFSLWTLVNAASVPAGFALASRFHSEGATALRVWLVGICLGLAVLPLAVFVERSSVHASYAQFYGDYGIEPVLGGPLGWLCLWGLLGVLSATWWARRCLKYLALGGTVGT